MSMTLALTLAALLGPLHRTDAADPLACEDLLHAEGTSCPAEEGGYDRQEVLLQSSYSNEKTQVPMSNEHSMMSVTSSLDDDAKPAAIEAKSISKLHECSALRDQGSHFTVDVSVGTPGQTFSVVADTGSNWMIIPSCVCRHSGSCKKRDRCFIGTKRSTSFKLFEPVTKLRIGFGSGTIDSVVALDQASVGGRKAFMKTGILLMVDRKLRLEGPFEGILGLGIGNAPVFKQAPAKAANDADSIMDAFRRILKKIVGGGGGIGTASTSSNVLTEKWAQREDLHHLGHTFVQAASIRRFSMCFGEGDGVLRFDVPAVPTQLASIGQEHWGLDFRGVSVGSKKLDFCAGSHMRSGQQSPCAVIPDSGTTMLMAPAEHLEKLFDAACSAWPRCASNHSALENAAQAASVAASQAYGFSPWNYTASSKAKVFTFLLQDCKAWLPGSSEGLRELPALRFHLTDSSGSSVALEFHAADYVFEVDSNLTTQAGARAKALPQKICMPAMAPLEYNTSRNGPVWILGLPLFYAYTVTYDATPPSVGFTSAKEEACGSCDEKLGFVSTGVNASRHAADRSWAPRHLEKLPRMPSFDTRKPL